MSHLIEEYAKCLGVKIGRQQISDHFYPITSDKYITLQTSKGIQTRNNSQWETVDTMIKKKAKVLNVNTYGLKEDYNSKVAESKKLEEANFARMSGDFARRQATAAQFGYYAQAGTSLLKAFG